MSQKGKESRIIPSVLSIPEKLNGLLLRVLKMRLTLERVFSVRDLLLLLGAFLLFLLRSVIPLPGILRTVFMILILLLAGIPVLLQGIRLGLRRAVPYEEAAVLLAEGRLSVMEIAGMFGYENCSKFAAAFRGEYGMSPSDYRRLHRLGF